jgi:hypothetical protein
LVRWTLPVVAPQKVGLHRAQWQMALRGELFGPVMSAWVFVSPNLDPGDIDLDPFELFKEWIRGLFDQLVDRVRAFWEDLQRRLAQWLNLEMERLLQEVLEYLTEQCCGAAFVPPAVVLLSLWGLNRRRENWPRKK